jgi:addiction module RelE/StbE family toxin
MIIDFHKKFDKQSTKLDKTTRDQFKNRLELFTEDKTHPILSNHGLKGKYQGYRSINITGDIRAIFIEHTEDHIEFVYIGSHSQLYD